MPRIIKVAPVPIRGRSHCVLFLDEWPKGTGRERRGEVDGEVFELLSVMLDGGGRIHTEPVVAVEIAGRGIEPEWFMGKELRGLQP